MNTKHLLRGMLFTIPLILGLASCSKDTSSQSGWCVIKLNLVGCDVDISQCPDAKVYFDQVDNGQYRHGDGANQLYQFTGGNTYALGGNFPKNTVLTRTIHVSCQGKTFKKTVELVFGDDPKNVNEIDLPCTSL